MRMNSPQSSKMLLSTMSATSEASKHPSQPLNNQMSGYTSHYIDRNSSGGTSSHQTRNDHRIVKNNLQPFYQHQTSHQLSSTHETLIDAKNVASDGFGFFGYLLIGLSYFLVLCTFPLSICCCIKIVKEYERAVIFRLGRSLLGGAKGPGLFFILPCIDSIITIDLRTITFDVAPQEILTKDSVTITVDAVVYFRIFNPIVSVTNVENAQYSTRLLAATTLRNILGTRTLQEILQDREVIAHHMQEILDVATETWGVKVERVEVKDVRLPVQMQRAMATEAEATREARAKVVAAEGEQKASVALKLAADTINQSPLALQLRYLQTLTHIAAEKNSTIIFPIPIELLCSLPGAKN